MAQKVKYLPAIWETWVWSLGQEGPLEKGMATHSSVLVLRIPGTGRLVGCRLWGRTESDTTKATQQQQQHVLSMPSFWRVFYLKWMLNFVKGSLFIYFLVFVFQFVNVLYNIDWFENIEEFLHTWDKTHLVMMYDVFNTLLDSVC